MMSKGQSSISTLYTSQMLRHYIWSALKATLTCPWPSREPEKTPSSIISLSCHKHPSVWMLVLDTVSSFFIPSQFPLMVTELSKEQFAPDALVLIGHPAQGALPSVQTDGPWPMGLPHWLTDFHPEGSNRHLYKRGHFLLGQLSQIEVRLVGSFPDIHIPTPRQGCQFLPSCPWLDS